MLKFEYDEPTGSVDCAHRAEQVAELTLQFWAELEGVAFGKVNHHDLRGLLCELEHWYDRRHPQIRDEENGAESQLAWGCMVALAHDQYRGEVELCRQAALSTS